MVAAGFSLLAPPPQKIKIKKEKGKRNEMEDDCSDDPSSDSDNGGEDSFDL